MLFLRSFFKHRFPQPEDRKFAFPHYCLISAFSTTAAMDTSRAPHLRVPVLFRDPVQTAEHDGQDLVDVLLDQAQDVLVVPEVERPLGHLTAEERDVGTEQRRDTSWMLVLHDLVKKSYCDYYCGRLRHNKQMVS